MDSRITLQHLPNEILSEIAYYLPLQHGNHVVHCGHIAAFSSTSRLMRAIALPHLFAQMPITSNEQFQCLAYSSSPTHIARFARELNVFMDEDFMDAWVSTGAPEHIHSQSSPFAALIHIIGRAPQLRALRIRVAEPVGGRTAWRKFSLARASGIEFGRVFNALQRDDMPGRCLSRLRILELDGFQDIEPLLRLAPTLETLRLSISAGYSQSVNDELVNALRLVPKLKHLAYTPDTLRLTHKEKCPKHVGTSVDMLFAIAELLPHLETLDLQTRHHRHAIYLLSSSEPLVETELLDALLKMPRLTSIFLPSSTIPRKDFYTLRTPLPIPNRESALEQLPILRNALKSRSASLLRCSQAEVDVVRGAGRRSSNLREVTFVRNAEADDLMEYAIRYSICRAPCVVDGSSRIPRIQLLKPEVLNAAADARHSRPLLPPAPPTSLALTLRNLWAVPPETFRSRTTPAAWSLVRG